MPTTKTPEPGKATKSALQVFAALGLAIVAAGAALVLALIGAIAISGCVGECTTPDLTGGIPFFVGAALAGATTATSTYWMISNRHKRMFQVFVGSAVLLAVPLAIWAAILYPSNFG